MKEGRNKRKATSSFDDEYYKYFNSVKKLRSYFKLPYLPTPS